MERKALLKNNQASSTDGIRSISFQNTRARLIRKACSLKCFRKRLSVMRGGRFTADPLQMQAMRQWSLSSWLKTAEVYLEGKLVRMIFMRVPMFTDLGLYLVGSLIICVRLRASSLDCGILVTYLLPSNILTSRTVVDCLPLEIMSWFVKSFVVVLIVLPLHIVLIGMTLLSEGV